MALGYLRIRHGGTTISIPVVSLGSSPVPSKIRAKVPAGVGEVPLVTLDDNRASKLRVRQGGVTYAVSADERRSITHQGPWTALVGPTAADSVQASAPAGTTTFNKVTQIQAEVYLRARVDCSVGGSAQHLFWGYTQHQVSGVAWVRVKAGGTYYDSVQVSVSASTTDMSSSSLEATKTQTVTVNVPAGQYEVEIWVQASRGGDHASYLSVTGEAKINWWVEAA